ncbi:MAG: hypothetical protein CL424_14740 [Acidimicrobiaceae bacterium]|nr:hypothetical protein [Acidimicrobiaceae bacterium]
MAPMATEAAESNRPLAGGHAFWWRLCDNFFRRWWLFLLPVIVLGALGVTQARSTLQLYRTTATLSVSTNPLLPEQPVRGAEVGTWETLAAATSRTINERLGTDAFLSDVADGAGLGEAVEAGTLSLDVVRSSVWASASGDSLVSVNATWADPRTVNALAQSTVDEYRQFLGDTVARAATSAEEFWTERLVQLDADRDDAEGALVDYVAGLPALEPGEDYPVTVQVEVNRLSGRLEALEAEVSEVEGQIDTAVLTRTQQTASAGESFSVIDPPSVPASPESTVVRQAMTVVAFVLMGVVVAIAALLVTTVLDRTISSPFELMAVPTVATVVTVPARRRARSTPEESVHSTEAAA